MLIRTLLLIVLLQLGSMAALLLGLLVLFPAKVFVVHFVVDWTFIIVCWFVGGDDLTGTLQFLKFQLSPPPLSSLDAAKSMMVTFWYRPTQVILETGR